MNERLRLLSAKAHSVICRFFANVSIFKSVILWPRLNFSFVILFNTDLNVGTTQTASTRSSMFLSLSLQCQLLFLPLHSLFTSTLHLASAPSTGFHSSTLLSVSLCFTPPPVSLSLSLSPGWVPAVGLVALVAGVTARLSGVAGDQGGRLAARTMGAERLRLTTGHLSRAISVGAEARSPLVGPAYCEDQRQSVCFSLSLQSLLLLFAHICR